MRLVLILFLTGVLVSAASAQGGRTDHTCSSQLRISVANGMPPGTRDLDPNQLSCLGLTQVYFLQTSFHPSRAYELRQRIEAVFRREGLTR